MATGRTAVGIIGVVDMNRSTRLYASSIAIVSGLYAVARSVAGMAAMPMMGEMDAGIGIGGGIMLALGIVVLLHGIVLLSPAAGSLAAASSPLMVLWAVLMLLNQSLFATTPGWGMGGMGRDPGMVAIAVLMLVSGLIMRSEPDG